MTILPPPPKPRHECNTPAPLSRDSWASYMPAHQNGTLWECPVCGRWWKCRHVEGLVRPKWSPVRWYDVPARRRIAAHETDKHATTTHWWDCHPNPNRGRP